MKLTLVMPTGLRVGYDEFFSTSPLGLETLAAHALPHAEVSIVDMRGRGQDVNAHAEMLLAARPDMIGIGLNAAPHTNYVLALSAAIRRQDKKVQLLTGGQQATFLPEEMLAEGHFDVVARGEGELTLAEILQRGDWRGVEGVSWRDGAEIHHEPLRPLIADLDTIGLPQRGLLPDRSRYRMGKYRVEGIESSRGCPFMCSFCSIRNFHRGKWRPKSVARVMQEIEDVLQRYPEPKVIYFADDNFAQDIRRVEGICRAIIERKTDAYFWCQARVDRLAAHPDVVELMGKAHFSAVLVGLETPIPRLLKSARKGTTPEQIASAIDLLHKHDIGAWGTFTLGLPGETPEDTAVSAAFIPKAKVDVCQITVATPIPGSALYDEAKKNGDILITDWDQYDFTSPTLKGQLPKDQLDAHMRRAYLKVYTSGRFWLSLLSERTNLQRLRRTAFGVFGSFIKFLIKERFAALVGKKMTPPPQF